MADRYLKETEVAEITGLSVHFFRKKRLKGGGPRFVKLGRAVRYSENEFSAWLAEHRPQRSTSDT
jgi:predicted DNA-binding transcriptional regulator AlpA